MAKSLEETLKDLRAGGYSEGSIRNWLVNKGFPSAKVDKAMALRTAKDSSDRRSRLHRALDCVLDRKTAKDFKPQGRECDACGAHLGEKNFTAPGSWSYKCPRCRFSYNHSSSKSVDEQLESQHKTPYRNDD